jgi:phosphoribosylaminoimidazolecarboxamide formyltransferase/IMP cyclohydrolase
MLDADAAWQCLSGFSEAACVIVKHANPCGVAVASNIEMAFSRAFAADSLSAFGGIVALNRPCSKELAKQLSNVFIEIIIAPSFEEAALEILAAKPNVRVLTMGNAKPADWEMRYIAGGILMQECDRHRVTAKDLQCVTMQQPSEKEVNDLIFAWQVVKHIKSNAILLSKDQQTVGMGAGQVSRVDAVDLALKKAGEQISGCVLASDAFFPFRDSIDRLADTGVIAIIQPGGSKRDQEVIDACDEHGLVMVFTGARCFRH